MKLMSLAAAAALALPASLSARDGGTEEPGVAIQEGGGGSTLQGAELQEGVVDTGDKEWMRDAPRDTRDAVRDIKPEKRPRRWWQFWRRSERIEDQPREGTQGQQRRGIDVDPKR